MNIFYGGQAHVMQQSYALCREEQAVLTDLTCNAMFGGFMKTLTLRLAASAFALVLATGAAGAQSLMLYTSQPEADAAKTVEAFKAANPGVDVQIFRSGTSDLLTKLAAEFAADAPQPDVLLIADAVSMELLKKDDRLLAYPEAKTDGIEPSAVDAEKTYFGTKLITTGIVHHLRAPFVPKRWADLVDPRAKGQVAMPSPAVSGAAAIHLLALTQNPGLGWPYVEALVAAGVQARGGNGPVMQAVAGGERAFGMVIDYLPIREAAKGAPVRFVFPEDGVSAITEPAAILSTARNVPAAVALIDFLLSPGGQRLAAAQGFLPADPAVAPPPGFPNPRTIRIMRLDAARAAQEREETLKRFAALAGS